ncbi:MAG: class I fructose-bisphosphate aldolase [Thermoleophilaceae bacterium]
MSSHELELTAQALVAEGKGILAADESNATIAKRFASVGVESTPEARAEWRELLVTTPGASDAISGVILYDETFRQHTELGPRFPEAVEQAGMIPGVKVDTGAKPRAGEPREKVTEGLDGLRDRLGAYREGGARFTKWRAVIAIGDGVPTRACLAANAHALARFAALSQESGLVPVVEPDVLMEGDHPLERCLEVTEAMLAIVFDQLREQGVGLEGMLLKPNMVLPGSGYPEQAGVEEVAEATLRCMLRCVPVAVPGIVFLSGGQDEQRATAHLNAMNALVPQPWELSFSFARALQGTALSTWRGERANREAAQGAFLHRARCASAARRGRYVEAMEKELVA